MNKYLKMTREGFTLVELMIVVAIIGVLASIAVPQYSKFQAKSRQTEVKIQLGATYTVEQSYAAENSSYSACLGQIGYNRDGTKFYYTIGFAAGAMAGNTCAPGNAAGSCDTYQWRYCDGVSTANGCAAGAPQYISGAKCVTVAAGGTDFFLANIIEPTGTNNGAVTLAQVQTPANLPTATGTLSSQVFTVGAIGYILKSSTTAAAAPNQPLAGVDAWTIDQGKQILNIQSGLQ